MTYKEYKEERKLLLSGKLYILDVPRYKAAYEAMKGTSRQRVEPEEKEQAKANEKK